MKAVNTSYLTVCNLSPPRLPKVHDQPSLTLMLWVGQNGYWNLVYLERWPIIPLWMSTTNWWSNTQDARLKIVDTALMLCWRYVDTLLTLCWRSVDALLTLCWRSVDALLTLCWLSVDALLTLSSRSSSWWSREHVTIICFHRGDQCFDSV